jgi:hypothetical protein
VLPIIELKLGHKLRSSTRKAGMRGLPFRGHASDHCKAEKACWPGVGR